jgi:hypothetical protein
MLELQSGGHLISLMSLISLTECRYEVEPTCRTPAYQLELSPGESMPRLDSIAAEITEYRPHHKISHFKHYAPKYPAHGHAFDDIVPIYDEPTLLFGQLVAGVRGHGNSAASARIVTILTAYHATLSDDSDDHSSTTAIMAGPGD